MQMIIIVIKSASRLPSDIAPSPGGAFLLLPGPRRKDLEVELLSPRTAVGCQALSPEDQGPPLCWA